MEPGKSDEVPIAKAGEALIESQTTYQFAIWLLNQR
jgi:hypothetical protein